MAAPWALVLWLVVKHAVEVVCGCGGQTEMRPRRGSHLKSALAAFGAAPAARAEVDGAHRGARVVKAELAVGRELV